jgi:hypothetical protein
MAAVKRKAGTLARKRAKATMSSVQKQREGGARKTNYAEIYIKSKINAIKNAKKGGK